MQSLENVRIVVLKKPRGGVFFIILANKTLRDYSFLIIFSNISEELFYKTPPEVFQSTEAVDQKC